MSIKNSIQGATASIMGVLAAKQKFGSSPTPEAPTVSPEETPVKEPSQDFKNIYENKGNETLQNVYKSTRKADRNTFISNFSLANKEAKNLQNFISFRASEFKRRIDLVGGENTIKGQAILKQFKKEVDNTVSERRKEIAKFRKDKK